MQNEVIELIEELSLLSEGLWDTEEGDVGRGKAVAYEDSAYRLKKIIDNSAKMESPLLCRIGLHVWSKWKSIDDYFQIRHCINCNYSQKENISRT